MPDIARDKLELALITFCRYNRIPMLGICRGAQLLCAALGGSLWQDVTDHGKDHSIRLLQDTIAPAFKTDTVLMSSSTHHQAMRPTNEHMTIIATTDRPQSRYFKDDQVHLDKGAVPEVEIVSFDDGNSKALMIQGHPEYHTKTHPFAVLSRVLIQQCLDLKMMETLPTTVIVPQHV